MPDMKGMLTKKIGPLPAWGWGLVVGGGYLGYRVLSGKGISLTGSEAPATSTAAENAEAGEYASAGPGDASAVTYGYTPPDVIIQLIPSTEAKTPGTATTKTPALRVWKNRTDFYSKWGANWKLQAYKNAIAGHLLRGKKLAEAKRYVASHKVQPTTKLKGTQGTQVLRRKPTAAPTRRVPKAPLPKVTGTAADNVNVGTGV